MSQLKNKSEINRKAASFLHNNNYYPSVVHCSYYSCVQLMKHTLLNILGFSENDLERLQNTTEKGSHEVMINQITTHLKSKNLNARDFNNDINQLKKLRVKADYKEEGIDISSSSNSMALSDSVLQKLNLIK